jgi:hypothetical protein
MNQLMVKLMLSQEEVDLLVDIQEIQFGEIHNPRVGSSPPQRTTLVTQAEEQLIRALRKHTIGKITIHDGAPVGIEYPDKTRHGHACLKKIRFTQT